MAALHWKTSKFQKAPKVPPPETHSPSLSLSLSLSYSERLRDVSEFIFVIFKVVFLSIKSLSLQNKMTNRLGSGSATITSSISVRGV